MNSKLIFRNIGRLLLLLALQLMVFNNVYLGGYINPCVYVLFIAMLPTSLKRIPMMLIAFGAGLVVDISCNMIGFHTFACVMVAFLRGVWFDHIILHDNEEGIDTPCIQDGYYQQFAIYLFLILFVYHLAFYSLLAFSFKEILNVLVSTILSTFLTWVICIIYQTLFYRSNKGATLIVLMLLGFSPSLMKGQTAVGSWRDHLSYSSTTNVCAADDRIIACANGGIFFVDRDDNSIWRINKTTKLNDVGIASMAYDDKSQLLVVAYKNSNIDLIHNDYVYNISDIKRHDMGGGKQINNIRFFDNQAFLACGFGIVVVDLDRKEIKETYYLGTDGSSMNVNDIAFTDSLIVAATDSGLMWAPKKGHLLNIASNWSHDNSSLLAGQAVSSLAVDANGKLLALSGKGSDGTATLYRDNGDMAMAPWMTDSINLVRVSHNNTLVIFDNHIGIYDADGQQQHDISSVKWMEVEINDADLDNNGTLWMAHKWASLTTCHPENPEATLDAFIPNGPQSDNAYRIVSWNNELMVCPGGHSTTYAGSFIPANIYTFASKWSAVKDPDNLMASLMDVVDIAVNPLNPKKKTAAVWGYGILEIEDNRVQTLYNSQNSNGALPSYSQGGYTSLLTGAVAYDKEGNLWATNSKQEHCLVVHQSDGTWRSFDTDAMTGGADIDHLLCDSIMDLKIFWGRPNKIFLHDGTSKMAYIDPNNGAKLQTSSVQCVVQDHNGSLWVGTNKGIKVVYALERAFQNGGRGEKSPLTCSNILFNENGINEYLMAYESITAIAVDGANRKWIGTSTGGLYLVSANGLQQIEHFTAATSPLFSDKIVSLCIMPWSGELFVGTDKGIQSFRTSATYAFGVPQNNIYAFPNPVRPDYEGPIAIKGFSRNALVHITDEAGQTVFATRANGGQAIWNGCSMQGKPVASGTYFVFASSDDGEIRSVTKILVIR